MPHEPPGVGTYFAIMMTGSDTEVAVAVRQIRKWAAAAKIDGHDVAQAIEQRNDTGKVVEQNNELLRVAKELKAERDQMASELARVRANGTSNSFAAALWQDTRMPATVDNRSAQWLLDLAGQGRLHLTPKETDFATSCTRRRRLSDPMKDWLIDIVRKAIARTGEAPPP